VQPPRDGFEVGQLDSRENVLCEYYVKCQSVVKYEGKFRGKCPGTLFEILSKK
jgi:hypothetical protein